MGDPSLLRFVPASSGSVPIDWTKMPEASIRFFVNNWGTDWNTSTRLPLPATIDDLAKIFHDSKFFGYMGRYGMIIPFLLDISEFGLSEPPQSSLPITAKPRFYMKYLENVWFIMFCPEKRETIVGFSAEIEEIADEEGFYDEEREAANDRALAEEYDPKLCEEIERIGTLGVEVHWKIADWDVVRLV